MSFESISGLSDIGNVSIIVAVVAALLYYFGILIGDTQVEKYEKTASYIEGLAFSIKYIAAPFVLIMLFVNFTGLRIPFWWGVGTQVIINSLLGSVIFASQYIKKYGLQGKIKSIAHQETERLVEANRLLAKIDEDRKKTSQKTVEEAISFSYYELPTKYLGNKYIFFLSSLIIIWGFYSYLPNFQFLSFETLLLLLLSFVNFTLLALAYGFKKAKYPFGIISLKNGENKQGKILKFGDYVYLLRENEPKKIFINRDEIVSVEEYLDETVYYKTNIQKRNKSNQSNNN